MDERINIAAVCGNEVRIYGEKFGEQPRPLLKVLIFPHHGAARLFAQEFEASQRDQKPKR